MRCEYCGQHDYNYHDNIDYYHDNLVNDHNHSSRSPMLRRRVQRRAARIHHHDDSPNHDYNIVHDYNDRARERVRGPSVPGNLLAAELVRL